MHTCDWQRCQFTILNLPGKLLYESVLNDQNEKTENLYIIFN